MLSPTLMMMCVMAAWWWRQEAAAANYTEKKSSMIYNVLGEILDGYRPEARPVLSWSDVMTVNISFKMNGLKGVDEIQQTMSINMYLDVTWTDHHLTWDRWKYGGIDHIVVPQEKVWVPDMVVTTLSGGMERLGYDDLCVEVDYQGTVKWEPSGLFTTHCSIDITFFPFDKQFCRLRVEMWTSSQRDVVLRLNNESRSRSPVNDLDYLKTNAEWEVIKVEALHGVINTSSDAVFSMVELRLVLRRRPMFVSSTIVLPTVLLALLSTLVFAVPIQSGEKMSVSVTMFLTIVLSLSILLNVLPHSALHLSVHVTYLALLSSQSAFAVCLSLWVMHIHNRGQSYWTGHRRMPVGPQWTRFVRCIRRYRASRVRNLLAGLPCFSLRSSTTPNEVASIEITHTRVHGESDRHFQGEGQGTDFESDVDLSFQGHGFQNGQDGFQGEGLGFQGKGHGFQGEGHGFQGEGRGFQGEGYGFQGEGHGFQGDAFAQLHGEGLNMGSRADLGSSHLPVAGTLREAPRQQSSTETLLPVQEKNDPTNQPCSCTTRYANILKAASSVNSTSQSRTGNEAVTWSEVADCLDFVLFRSFLMFICIVTAVSKSYLILKYNSDDDEHDWAAG